MITDFFVAESLIIARLESKITALTRILPAADLAAMLDPSVGWKNVSVPTAYVGFFDYQLLDTPNPLQQKFSQRWYVLLVTRHVGTIENGSGARAMAGPILVSIIHSLLGWLPSSDLSPLQLESAGGRWTYRDGKLIYPLVFSTILKLSGA